MNRISTTHYFLCIKDEMLDGTGGEFAHVLAVPNEIDWREVREALTDTGFKGKALANALTAQGAVDLCACSFVTVLDEMSRTVLEGE